MLPWQKVDNADVLAGLRDDPAKVPRWVALAEARAIVDSGQRSLWPVRRLATRWGWGRSWAAAVLKDAEADAPSEGPRTSADKPRTTADKPRTTADKRSFHTGPEGVPRGQGADTRGQTADTRGQTADTRARYYIERDLDLELEETTQGPSAAAPEATDDDLDAAADPFTLSAIWQEELIASPAALRGKPPGNLAPWPTDLLLAGPADAETAVRAVAELLRGTDDREPALLDWSLFFGPRARHPSAWQEALAWAQGVAGEPWLGRNKRPRGKAQHSGAVTRPDAYDRPEAPEQSVAETWAGTRTYAAAWLIEAGDAAIERGEDPTDYPRAVLDARAAGRRGDPIPPCPPWVPTELQSQWPVLPIYPE